MKKNLFLLFFFFSLPLFADEVDDLIDYALVYSPGGQSVQYSIESGVLSRQDAYYALIPDLEFSAGYDLNESASGADYLVSLSSSFGDVDQILTSLRVAENDALINEIEAELEKRDLISEIIEGYAELAVFEKQQELSEAEISNNLLLLRIMTTKMNYGDEIAINVQKLSNEIAIDRQNLILNALDYTNALNTFDYLCGMLPNSFLFEDETLNGSVSTEDLITQYELKLSMLSFAISNSSLELSAAKREQFLPNLSFSLGWDYDVDASRSGYDASIGISFDALRFFEQKNDIEELEISIAEQEISVSDLLIEWENDLSLLENRILFQEEKMDLLKNDVDIELQLRELYNYQYETDQIDFYDYQVLQNDLLTAELLLLEAKSELFLLKKQLEYGILSP